MNGMVKKFLFHIWNTFVTLLVALWFYAISLQYFYIGDEMTTFDWMTEFYFPILGYLIVGGLYFLFFTSIRKGRTNLKETGKLFPKDSDWIFAYWIISVGFVFLIPFHLITGFVWWD